MALYGKGRRPSSLNRNVDGSTNQNLSGRTDTPYGIQGTVPDRVPFFKSAVADFQDNAVIQQALAATVGSVIKDTLIPSIATGKFATLFMGYPGKPDDQFLFNDPSITDASKFFEDQKDDCIELAIFAQITSGVQSDRASFDSKTSRADLRPGYFLPDASLPPTLPSNDVRHTTIFVEPQGAAKELI